MKYISNMETESLCRGLSELIHAGISAGDGLHLLAEEAEHPEEKAMLLELAEKADCGFSLYESFYSSGKFPAYVCAMILAGEKTGKLEGALRSIASGCQERHRAEEQIRAMVLYPAVLFLAMTAVITVLLTRVLPVFASVYGQLGGSLTGIAGWLLSLGHLISRLMPAVWLLLGAAAFVLVLAAFSSSFRAKSLQLWNLCRRERGIGRMFACARTAQVLAMAMESGLPVEESLLLAAEQVAHMPDTFRRFQDCSRKLAEGAKVGEAFREFCILPAAECRLLETGIKSGAGDRVMGEIAFRLQEQAENTLYRRVSQAEPVMVLSASVLTGFIILSVMAPMTDIMAALG